MSNSFDSLDVNAIFDSFTTEDAANTLAEKKSVFKNENVYKPSIKDEKAKDQTYRALIRFIPFIHDGKVHTTIERWECYLKDIDGNNGVFVVSPKTVGKRCPMRDLSYRLYTSENAIDKANSKKINVYQQWYSLVEVVKDPQHTEYEGKVYIYQFGKKIYDKIIDATKGSDFKEPINPFDFFDGHLFNIDLKKGTAKMDNGNIVANYDACGFIEKSAPIHFGDGQTLTKDIESKKAFMTWLENDAPKIKDYFFKEWDDELTDKVNTNLASFTSGYTAPTKSATTSAKEIIDNIVNEPKSEPVEKKSKSEPTPEPDVETITDDDDEWVNNILNN
ncbi:MAG: hypothetical protein NC548_21330 [Lachnospiraceae bacterium]|nr:hypothetical protein [Lachnospiraceae bacterium]